MSEDLRPQFARDGFLVVPGLLEDALTAPVLEALRALIAARFPTLEDDGDIHTLLRAAQALDRGGLAAVYDAVRKTAAFWRLIGSPALQCIAQELLDTQALGVAFHGAGIRLDLPGEDRWRSDWHQEYHAQLTSQRGLVAWFPFADVDDSMGPVSIACGSHALGVLPARCDDPLNRNRDYTRAIAVPSAAALAARHPRVAPTARRGDVVFIDFLTLHASGFNRSERTRITGQVRFVDLLHDSAVRIGWRGGMHEGGSFAELHPDLVLEGEAHDATLSAL